MTIYESTSASTKKKEVERVPLHEVKNRAAMHALMKEKGFVLRSDAAAVQAEHRQALDREAAELQQRLERLRAGQLRNDSPSGSIGSMPPISTMVLLYGGVSAMLALLTVRRRRRKKLLQLLLNAATAM
jgi:hypothetical protein